MGEQSPSQITNPQIQRKMKKFLFMMFGLALFCMTVHAADDAGMSYAPTSEQINAPDFIVPAMPVVMPVQFVNIQTAPVAIYVVSEDFITSQMASQKLYVTIETKGRKDFTPPNCGKAKHGWLNHYRNYNYNYKH